MLSALSGNSALSLLSMFGRSHNAGGTSESPSASRPPPPPPPPLSQGNGASTQSIFDALFASDQASLGQMASDLVAGLDQDGDGKLTADELTSAFSDQTVPLPGGGSTESLVKNILANLDSDGDSAVSADELASGLQDMAASGPPPGPPPARGSEDISSLIKGLDANGDGELSAEELSAAFGSQDGSAPSEAGSQKSIQELLFSLLLDQNGTSGAESAKASALYGG